MVAPVGYFAAPTLLGVINAAPAVQAEALPFLRIMFVFNFGMMMFFMLGGGSARRRRCEDAAAARHCDDGHEHRAST